MKPPIAATFVMFAAGATIALAGGTMHGLTQLISERTVPASVVPLPMLPSIPQDTMHLVLGDSLDLAAGVPADSASTLVYKVGNPSVAEVSPAGVLRALSLGTTQLTTSRGTVNPQLVATTTIAVVTRRLMANMLVSEICPNEDESRFAESAPIQSDILLVHEYHDCQRLIAGTSYGPPVGILAHRNVATAKTWEAFSQGILAAVIVDFVNKGKADPYPWLGIEPGTNCLVVRATSATHWEAAIIPQKDSGDFAQRRNYASCDDKLTWKDVPDNRKGMLVVRLQHGYDMQDRVVSPPTARWDWDEEHRHNYIGVKCEAISWCEIGPREFKVSAAQANPKGHPLFKGYYDEQYLADTTKPMRPSTVFGTLMPGKDAKSVHDMKHWFPRWYDAAVLMIRDMQPSGGAPSSGSSAFARYRAKFMLALGGAASSPTARGRLRLHPKNILRSHSGYHPRMNNNSNKRWSIEYRWHGESALRVPTVRWRWVESDERTWSYCDPEGCCELMGMDM